MCKFLTNMIAIESTPTGLKAVDSEKNEVEIEIDGWEAGGESREIGRPVDETIAGCAEEVRLPPATVCMESGSSEQWDPFPMQSGQRYLSEESNLVQIEANVTVFLRFDSRASVIREEKGGPVTVRWPGKT
jgi:hypothetical protein